MQSQEVAVGLDVIQPTHGGSDPLGRLPGMISSKVIFVYLHEGILLTWPKYVSCFTRTLLTMEIWKFRASRIAVFLILHS